MSSLPVAAAVLAAGRGTRLGGDAAKPLLRWRGRPLVQWAVDAALASGLAPVIVVVGYRGDEVRSSIPVDPGVRVVENTDWDQGIASSLHAALEILMPMDAVAAVCVGLADQPLVGAEAYRRLAAHGGAAIVEARYGGEPGNPVKLARSLWPDAMQLRGDVGARALMRDHLVDVVECGDTGSAADIDTLEDLDRMQRQEESP
ncbi:MAG: NTP transferase domain-containing protein [Acidimicrobiia bacterium]